MQIPFLSKTHYVIALDMSIHRLSDQWKIAYDMKVFSEDLYEPANKLKLGKTTSAVNEWNCRTQLGLEDPHMVRGPVLAGTRRVLINETIKARI
jgi:hypothetical protein